jgi:hypothetical protein
MKKIAALVPSLTLLLSLPLAGCGKILSDAQQSDVTNIVGGVSNTYQKTPGVSLDDGTGREPSFLAFMSDQMRGAIWLMKFKSEGELAQIGRDGYTISSCPSTTYTSGSTSCAFSCPTTSSLKLSCSATTTSTSTCNGTAYSLSSPSFTLTYDFSKVTGSTLASSTGTFALTLGFGGNVSGGNLDGKALACTIGLTFDVAKAQAGTAQVPSLGCDNFSCTYDGKEVECAKVQSSMSSKSCS